MNRYVKEKVIGVVIASGILVTSCSMAVHYLKPSDVQIITPIEEKIPGAAVVSREAIIRTLSSEGQIIGLTGDIDKRAQITDSKWYGDRTIDIAILGEFKMGIDTDEIEINTSGNTVTVHFPQPKILSVTTNYDEAVIVEKTTGIRKDFSTEEQQAIFKQTREEAIKEIKNSEYFEDRAEKSISEILKGLIEQIPDVQEVDVQVKEGTK